MAYFDSSERITQFRKYLDKIDIARQFQVSLKLVIIPNYFI